MKKLFFILFLIPLLSNCQDQKIVAAGDTIDVQHGYNSDNQSPTVIEHNDTIIVVGKNPKYVELYNGRMSMGLKYKLPKGIYINYQLKGKYWKKVYVNGGYNDFNGEIVKEKYRGHLSSITTYGEDSLVMGLAKSFKYNPTEKRLILIGAVTYQKGVKNGVAIEYYDNGNIRYVGNYKDGKEHGTWFGFSEQKGGSVVEFKYQDGKRVD